jgi:hypothetical protein
MPPLTIWGLVGVLKPINFILDSGTVVNVGFRLAGRKAREVHATEWEKHSTYHFEEDVADQASGSSGFWANSRSGPDSATSDSASLLGSNFGSR